MSLFMSTIGTHINKNPDKFSKKQREAFGRFGTAQPAPKTEQKEKINQKDKPSKKKRRNLLSVNETSKKTLLGT